MPGQWVVAVTCVRGCATENSPFEAGIHEILETCNRYVCVCQSATEDADSQSMLTQGLSIASPGSQHSFIHNTGIAGSTVVSLKNKRDELLQHLSTFLCVFCDRKSLSQASVRYDMSTFTVELQYRLPLQQNK